MQLYEPQRKAVDKLKKVLEEGNVAGNWSKTGTGKTIMSLQLAKELGLEPLIVAPIAAHATWHYWIKALGVSCHGVFNCEKLRLGKTEFVESTGQGKKQAYVWTLDPDKDMVIWDEVHRGLSGHNTLTGKMAAMLRPHGIKTVLASATPFNSPLNARSLGYLFRLHNWNSGSFFSWCRAHGCVASPFHRGLDFNVHSKSAKNHLDRINAAIRDRCVTLTVEDLAEYFPDGCLVEPYLIKLNERDEEEARRIYAEMDEKLKKKNNTNPLVDMMRARQRCELLKTPAMAEMIQDAIEEGNNVFVAVCFRETIKKLIAELGKLDIKNVVEIHGQQKQSEREASVQLFNSDIARVLIGTIQAGGESISLHQKEKDQNPRTSLISPGYSASQLVQALGRIKRGGMLSPVVQRVVLCANTIEERVAARLQAKVHAIETITDSDLE